ncbi:MAG: glycoside hydrolase family 38 C-terminal domain-containing protein [bacterium]|nr:glycoside hydrolase family 38 C-terminal domain-containing protein [bacterium]
MHRFLLSSRGDTVSNDGAFQMEGVAVSSEHKPVLEALMIPPGEKIIIHMVHLSHLDLMWYWQLSDTIEMSLDTIRWHVEMLEKHPDGCYSHTQIFILKLVEQIDPELFGRFSALVDQGRIELDSGQWVEPDSNLPCGESLARQFLYGQKYIESRFGIRARTLVNSDSFGHCSSLPQIMQQAGIEHAIIKRPRQRYVDLPETPFLWQGIDGTTIPLLRFINKGAGLPSLSQYYDLPHGLSELQEKVNRNLNAGFHHLLGSHCNSDAGGVSPYVRPCRGDKYELRYSTPSGFWNAVESENTPMPVVNKSLNYIYQGCYTTHIEEKQHCRQAEKELREIEVLWTHAALIGHGYPCEQISEVWHRLCFLQFHDILPGTGSSQTHADSTAIYHKLFLQTNILRRKAQLLLGRHISRRKAIRTIAVANSGLCLSGGIATADVDLRINREDPDSECIPDTGLLADEAGVMLPYQIVDQRQRQRFVHGTMIFPSQPVSSLGLKSYRLIDGSPDSCPVHAEGNVIENEYLRIEVGGPGIVKSIANRQEELEWLKSPIRIELWPETDYPGDYGSPMKAWFLGVTDVCQYAEPVGKPEVVENGPVRATIRMEYWWGASRFRIDVSLYAGQDYVELRIEMDWHEKEVLARICTEPLIRGKARRRFGIPFGSEDASGDELELPAIGWADMSDEDGGIAVLNRDRPGHTFQDGCIRTSLVRCATGDWDPCTDSGIIHTTLRILPHKGGWKQAGIPARAEEFIYPLIAWQSETLAKDYSQPTEALQIKGEGIILSCIKVAEDRKGYLLRFYESLGGKARAEICLTADLNSCIPFNSNILEDELEPLELVNGRLSLTFAPFEVKSIRLQTTRPIAQVEDSFTAMPFVP